eukprot:scaffold59201_cov35-Attheya_sp.AAC.1
MEHTSQPTPTSVGQKLPQKSAVRKSRKSEAQKLGEKKPSNKSASKSGKYKSGAKSTKSGAKSTSSRTSVRQLKMTEELGWFANKKDT